MFHIPEALEVLTEHSPTPIAGSATEAFALARVLQSVADDARHVRQLSYLSVSDLTPLTGTAITALITLLDDHVAGAATILRADVLDIADRLLQYGRDIDRIHDEATQTLRDCDQALDRIRDAHSSLVRAATVIDSLPLGAGSALAAIPGSWRTPPPETAPAYGVGDLTPAALSALEIARRDWMVAAQRWGEELTSLHRLMSRWESLHASRVRAEQRLEQALTSSLTLTALAGGRTGRTSRSRLARILTGLPNIGARMTHDTEHAWLTSGLLSAPDAARAWASSHLAELSLAEIAQLDLELLLLLAGAVGVPAAVQNVAARESLRHALADPEVAYRRMGFVGSSMSLREFKIQVRDMTSAVALAESLAREQNASITVQLLQFGNHDDQLTGALTVGDVDAATHFGVNVSGMFSTTSNMIDTYPGVVNLYAEAERSDATRDYAVVHWIGYRSPTPIPGEEGVFGPHRAQAGAARLSDFIDGLSHVREAVGAQPFNHISVFAHSYGSTTAVEAMKQIDTRVDHLATYGSAGVHMAHHTELNVERISATDAKGDGVAGIGIYGSERRNPIGLRGVTEFSSERVAGFLPVTSHDMYVPEGESTPINWRKTGYLSDKTHSVQHMGRILAGREQ